MSLWYLLRKVELLVNTLVWLNIKVSHFLGGGFLNSSTMGSLLGPLSVQRTQPSHVDFREGAQSVALFLTQASVLLLK